MKKKILALILAAATALMSAGCGNTAGEGSGNRETETADWLTAHGITVTPQGDCTVQFYGYQDDVSNPSGDFPAKVSAVISETTEGADR